MVLVTKIEEGREAVLYYLVGRFAFVSWSNAGSIGCIGAALFPTLGCMIWCFCFLRPM